jgi:hypothetical protein
LPWNVRYNPNQFPIKEEFNNPYFRTRIGEALKVFREVAARSIR